MTGDPLQALSDALADNISDYVLEIDVTYVASDLPAGLSSMDMHVSFESNLDSWSQAFPLAEISGPTDQTITVELPLDTFELTAGLAWANMHIGFAGGWSGSATVYVDRIALTDTTFVAPENADFDGDGDIDGADWLVLQRGLGTTSGAMPAEGDANGDGAINSLDFDIWQSQYGTTPTLTGPSQPGAATVPEPAASVLVSVASLIAA